MNSPNFETAPWYSIEKFEVEITLKHTPQCNCTKLWNPKSNSLQCSLARTWLDQFYLPRDYKEVYYNLEMIPSHSPRMGDILAQIELDLPRTAPNNEYFTRGYGKVALKRILTVFAKYNPTVGYIQGINYIAANILWHTYEIEGFYLLLWLMDSIKLWENYLEGMPGVSRHVHILEYLLIEGNCGFCLDLHHTALTLDMLCYDWVMTLFGNLAPLDQMHSVLSLVFTEGWEGFYKLSIVVLERLHSNFDRQNLWESFMGFKGVQLGSSGEDFMGHLRRGKKEKLTWRILCIEASARKVNSEAIRCLNENWRIEFNIR